MLLSFALIAADLSWPAMGKYRGYLTLAVTPIQWIVDAPNRLLALMDRSLEQREDLTVQNEKLQADLLILARRLQRVEALQVENAYLRNLLNASKKIDERVELAELIGVNPNPFLHQIIINKGLRSKVYLGQPVLDADGVMGQVVEVGPYTSRVLLITDSQHAIPVEDNRSGFRSILVGNGSSGELLLDHVPDTADLKVGDHLISSGLGQRFPTGYPVAVVTSIEHDPGRPFAIVKAKPTARLDKSRHLLVVFRLEPQYELPEFDLDIEEKL